jgi:hypothetical protein
MAVGPWIRDTPATNREAKHETSATYGGTAVLLRRIVFIENVMHSIKLLKLENV